MQSGVTFSVFAQRFITISRDAGKLTRSVGPPSRSGREIIKFGISLDMFLDLKGTNYIIGGHFFRCHWQCTACQWRAA